jgi:hypothetical protein
LQESIGVGAIVGAVVAGIILGSFGGWFVGLLTYGLLTFITPPHPHYDSSRISSFANSLGTGTGNLLFVATVCLFLVFWRRRRAQAREMLIGKIVEECPHEVEGWGGVAILRNPVGVQELIRILEGKPRSAGTRRSAPTS